MVQRYHFILKKKKKIMPKLIKLIFILILYHGFIYASIDEEIEAIQQAPVEERFKLMNALKIKISKMQEKKRMMMIQEIQEVNEVNITLVKREDSNVSDENLSKEDEIIINNSLKDHIQNSIQHHTGVEVQEFHGGHDD